MSGRYSQSYSRASSDAVSGCHMTTCTDDQVLSCVAALTFRDGGTLLQVRAEPASSHDDDVMILPAAAAPLNPQDVDEPSTYTGEVEGVRERRCGLERDYSEGIWQWFVEKKIILTD